VTAWRTFLDHPLTGSGLDTFQVVYGKQRTPGYWALEWERTPAKAHDELLHLLATQGALGGLAYLGLLGALGWAGVRAWRRCQGEDRGLVLALSASALACHVQLAFGFPVAALAVLHAVVAGLLSRLAWPGSPAEGADR